MTRVAIALGSNLGDRLDHLRAGASGLSAVGDVVDVSSVFETDPVGGPEQGRYLNAVVLLDTDLAPDDVLAALLGIERTRGRVRDERWGPRTLDLDIVVFGDRRIETPGLVVPHPRAHERGFVLGPLVEVWPDAVLADGRPAATTWSDADRAGLRRWEGDWRERAPGLGPAATRWVVAQVLLFGVWLGAVVALPRADVGLVGEGGGVALAVGGLVVLEAARRSLGRELTPYPQPRSEPHLVDTGVYGQVRHPIYTGVLMLLGGVALAFGSIPGLATTAGLGVFFSFKARIEERALSVGVSGYSDYLVRVPSRFLPSMRTKDQSHGA